MNRIYLIIKSIVFCLLFIVTKNVDAQCTATVVQDDICGNNGIISVSTTIASPPYTYEWFDAASGNPFPISNPLAVNTDTTYNVAAGDYYCVVSSSCTTNTITVNNLGPSLVNFGSSVSCYGSCDGSQNYNILNNFDPITGLTPTGTPPYTFTYLDNNYNILLQETDNLGPNYGTSLTGLCEGDYYIVLLDGSGCVDTTAFQITEPSPLNIGAVLSDASCFGGSDGQIDLDITGGMTSAQITNTYYLTLIDSTSTITSQDTTNQTIILGNLKAGNYTLITEYFSLGSSIPCVDTSFYLIEEPNQINSSVTLDSVSCFGGNDGTLISFATGGTGFLSASWIGPNGFTSTTFVNNNLFAGAYSLSLIDSIGCADTSQYFISEPAPLSVNLDSTHDVSCSGLSDGYIGITPSGGVDPYSYLWTGISGSFSTQNILGLESGTYQLRIIDDFGCQLDTAFFVLQPNLLNVTVNSFNDPLCFGSNDGNIDITVSGGTLPYIYTWTDTTTGGLVSFNEDLTGVYSGGYDLLVVDTNGCTGATQLGLNDPAEIIVAVDSFLNVSCAGSADAEIYITATGGTGILNYNWTSPGGFVSNFEDINPVNSGNMPAGVYTINVSDNNNCVISAAQNITVPDPLLINHINGDDVSCKGGSDGFIDIIVSGGIQPYVYDWGIGFGNVSFIDGLSTGTYTINVTDSNNCQNSFSVFIDEPAFDLTAVVSLDSVICYGDTTGSANIIVQGGTSPYSYLWQNGDTTSFVNLPAGQFNYQVNDNKGCVFTDTIQIDQPLQIQANYNVTPESCDSQDGEIQINPSGGIQPYNILWVSDPLNNTYILSNLDGFSPGQGVPQTLIITDDNGCQDVNNIWVPAADPIVLDSAEIQHISCYLGNDGSVLAYVSGGISSLTYSWLDNNGSLISSSSNIFSLESGSYSLVAQDVSGCFATFPFIINETQTSALFAAIDSLNSFLNLDCFGNSNGYINLNVSGGTAFPNNLYEFTINGLIQTQWNSYFSGLSSGNYYIAVNDEHGCVDTIDFAISMPAEISVSLSEMPVNCYGGNDGQIYSSVTGGTSPYTYNWSNGSSTDTLINLSSNLYTVSVNDLNGCHDTASIFVTEPDFPLNLQFNSSNATCVGEDGSAYVSVQGGTAPYLYHWSLDYLGDSVIYNYNGNINSSVNSANLTDVYSGVYYVTVTDANGCIQVDSVVVGQDSSPQIFLQGTVNLDCYGDTDGQISVFALGGTPLYEYSISGGVYQATQVFTGLASGFYTITVRDSLGCTDNITATITEPNLIQVDSFSVTNVSCFGGFDGSILAYISGGTLGPNSEYQYNWYNSNGNLYPNNLSGLSNNVTNLQEGFYSISIIDDNGCSGGGQAYVGEPLDLIAVSSVTSNHNNNDISCFGYNDGSASASAFGGTPPYVFDWNGFDPNALSSGTYNITVTDANGCMTNSSVTLVDPPEIVSEIINISHVTCEGWSNGQAEVSVLGGAFGSGGYTYSWSDNAGNILALTQNIYNLPVGVYEVTVTGPSGCSTMSILTINDDDRLSVNVTGTDVSCFGFGDGQAIADISGGQIPYINSWSDQLNQQNDTASGLQPGLYVDTISDQLGCIILDSVLIEEPNELVISLLNISEIQCYNADDAIINVVGSGGVSPLSYTLNGNTATTNTTGLFNGLGIGSYSVVLEDGNGCQIPLNDIDILTQPAQIVINPIFHDYNGYGVSCHGESDGLLANYLNNTNMLPDYIQGGTLPYDVIWNNGNNSWSGDLPSGSNNFVVTDANGCGPFIYTFNLSEPPLLLFDSIYIDNYCAQVTEASIYVYAQGGVNPLSYLYDSNVSSSYLIDNLNSGNYNIQVQDINGCFIDSIVHVENPSLFNDTTICNTESLILNAGLNWPMLNNFSWHENNSNFYNDIILNVTLENNTTYIIEANDNGCYNTTPMIDTISINVLYPNVDISGDWSDGIILGESLDLYVNGSPGYLWSTGETTSLITVSPTNTTYYYVDAYDSQNGCPGSDTIRVYVGINDAFSPNGDGINDVWVIDYLNNYNNTRVEVYSRWGTLIYSSLTSPNISNWDGTYNGLELPVGTYYYIIHLENENLSGPLTIMR